MINLANANKKTNILSKSQNNDFKKSQPSNDFYNNRNNNNKNPFNKSNNI
jgi:hypothetical protein